MARTMHCAPNAFESSSIKPGFLTADEFTLTLSAPASSRGATSATELIPPPTVKGILMCFAISRTRCARVFRFSFVADISRKTSSSAPCAAYAAPSSTGSPASRMLMKLIPFTVLPSLISRQGIILLVSTAYVNSSSIVSFNTYKFLQCYFSFINSFSNNYTVDVHLLQCDHIGNSTHSTAGYYFQSWK